MAKYIPKLVEPLLNYVPSSGVQTAVEIAGKVARAKILFDQVNPNRPKVDRNGPTDSYEHEVTTTDFPSPIKKHRTYSRIAPDGYVSEPPRQKSRLDSGDNQFEYIALEQEVITIVDIDFQEELHVNTRKTNRLTLPFVPRELEYTPNSNFVTLASFGRNNPFYQYTGSEDSLTFEIDWFSKTENREDVIANCRWVEALSKGDAYDDVPHRIMLNWGSENKLFLDEVWLVVSAPYRLTQFQRAYRDKAGEVKSLHMLPQQAIQTITLKRVTKENRTIKQVIGNLGYVR